MNTIEPHMSLKDIENEVVKRAEKLLYAERGMDSLPYHFPRLSNDLRYSGIIEDFYDAVGRFNERSYEFLSILVYFDGALPKTLGLRYEMFQVAARAHYKKASVLANEALAVFNHPMMAEHSGYERSFKTFRLALAGLLEAESVRAGLIAADRLIPGLFNLSSYMQASHRSAKQIDWILTEGEYMLVRSAEYNKNVLGRDFAFPTNYPTAVVNGIVHDITSIDEDVALEVFKVSLKDGDHR